MLFSLPADFGRRRVLRGSGRAFLCDGMIGAGPRVGATRPSSWFLSMTGVDRIAPGESTIRLQGRHVGGQAGCFPRPLNPLHLSSAARSRCTGLTGWRDAWPCSGSGVRSRSRSMSM